MVMSPHRNGLRIELDVVHNHTAVTSRSNFDLTDPGYFYRHNADGSGCGSEMASERVIVRRFIVESVKYMAREYHINGFRFNLMGLHDIETMNRVREELSRINPAIPVYSEG